jgi:hypothetical protein
MPLRITSVLTVVCIILNFGEDKQLTKVIGSPLFGRKIDPNGDCDKTIVIRAGIFDDKGILNERTPVVEIYTKQRLNWVSPIEGADQFTGMLPLP